MGKMLGEIKTKIIEPRIYSIVWNGFMPSSPVPIQGLWTGVAYTLEEATNNIFKSIQLDPKLNLINAINVVFYNSLEFSSLGTYLKSVDDTKKEKGKIEMPSDFTEIKEKNILMKMIIDSGDIEQLEKNRNKLNVNEIKYIKDEINSKKI